VDESPVPDTPVMPSQMEGDAVIRFRCRKDIDCFNACCKNIDIMLTPYDIVRLKTRLGITSTEFLREYTEPFEFGRAVSVASSTSPRKAPTSVSLLPMRVAVSTRTVPRPAVITRLA
jgi:hypothetical protein